MNSLPLPGQKAYVEEPTKYGGSTVREATEEEIQAVRISAMDGNCNHGVCFDVDVYPWFYRHCFVCGELIGVL